MTAATAPAHSASARRASLLERLERSAAAHPGAVLIEAGGRRETLGALTARARRIAAALVRRGMRPGDRALFSIRPSADAIAAILAIDAAGGAIVPIDPRMGESLFRTRLALLAPRWVFAESLLYAATAPLGRALLGRRAAGLAPLGDVAGVTRVRTGRWLPGTRGTVTLATLEREGGPRDPLPHPDESTESFTVFTSGTTATPKAVVHTRRSLAAILETVEREVAMREDDVLHARDLHLILPALLAGARVVVPRSTTSDAARTLAELEAHGVTCIFCVTSDCRALVERCERTRTRLPASLREVMVGGAPAHTSFLARLRDVLPPGARGWCIYGMTEILPVARCTIEEKLAYDGDGDYVGHLVDGVRGRITGDGELVLRGDALFRGYLGSPDVIEHATGDLARLDARGLSLLGRKKDMIIRGDFNLYPELYEPVVERIDGVRRAAFVGIHDERAADERVVLVVEPEGDGRGAVLGERVARALREGATRIDGAALPDEIVVMPLPESGRSSKVDKVALRAMLEGRR